MECLRGWGQWGFSISGGRNSHKEADGYAYAVEILRRSAHRSNLPLPRTLNHSGKIKRATLKRLIYLTARSHVGGFEFTEI